MDRLTGFQEFLDVIGLAGDTRELDRGSRTRGPGPASDQGRQLRYDRRMTRLIFHLAFLVPNLAEAERFYVTYLDAIVGRRTAAWIDLLLFGHQLTIHERPREVLGAEERGVRDFGLILKWDDRHALAEVAPREASGVRGRALDRTPGHRARTGQDSPRRPERESDRAEDLSELRGRLRERSPPRLRLMWPPDLPLEFSPW